MTRRYEFVAAIAVVVAASCSGPIVLASLGFIADIRIAGVSIWPAVMVTIVACIFIASWAFTKAKGRSGWLGMLLPFLDIFGLHILPKLKDRTRNGRSHEA